MTSTNPNQKTRTAGVNEESLTQNEINRLKPLIIKNVEIRKNDLAESNGKILDEVASENLLKQIWEMWIEPEIIRRGKKSAIKSDEIPLLMAIVFPTHGSKSPYCLFDNECKVKAFVQPQNRGKIHKEEQIDVNDTSQLIKCYRPENIDPDDGYILLIRDSKGWMMWFDFIKGQNIVKNKAERLIEFIDSAEHAMNHANVFSFIENLFAAAELLVDLALLLKTVQEVSVKNHGAKTKLLKKAIHNNEIYGGDFEHTFDKLTNARKYARYANASESKMALKELKTHLQIVKDTHQQMMPFIESSVEAVKTHPS